MENTAKPMSAGENTDPYQILFGLNRQEDERSLADFLRMYSADRFTSVLIPRMTDEEIQQIVGLLSRIMRKHLSEKEYHALFLGHPK